MYQVRQEAQGDEIDLRKYVAVVVRRKSVVLTVFACSALAAGAIALMSRTSTLLTMIAPPAMAASDGGSQDFDSVESMKARIDAGVFNAPLSSELRIDEGLLRFDVSQPQGARLLQIRLTVAKDRAELGKRILTALTDELSRYYAKPIEDRRARIQNQIDLEQSRIAADHGEIQEKKEEYRILEARERECLEDMKKAKVDSDRLSEDAANSSERSGTKGQDAPLLRVFAMQQNASYFSHFKSELADMRLRKEGSMGRIGALERDISAAEIEIRNLKATESGMHNIVVIREPFVSRDVGTGKARKWALAGGAAGLVAGLFLAFLLEYWHAFIV